VVINAQRAAGSYTVKLTGIETHGKRQQHHNLLHDVVG
jgi:hypothetical protein